MSINTAKFYSLLASKAKASAIREILKIIQSSNMANSDLKESQSLYLFFR